MITGASTADLSVNKMDLIGYDQERYDAIVADYRAFASSIGIADFTGIDSPYEPPLAPEIHIDTTRLSADEAADHIVEHVIGVWSHDL